MNEQERKELEENTTKQWLLDFIVKYEKDNHTRLIYTVFDMATDSAASLSLYLNSQKIGGHVSVDIDLFRDTTINWVSGSLTTTVAAAIATRDLLSVGIEVAHAWSDSQYPEDEGTVDPGL